MRRGRVGRFRRAETRPTVIARNGGHSRADPPPAAAASGALDARVIGEIGLHAAVLMDVLAKIEAIAGRADDDALADEIACVVEAVRRRLEVLTERTRRGG